MALTELAYSLGTAGRHPEARKLLRHLEQRSTTLFVPAYDLAIIHVALKENEQALGLLQRAMKNMIGPYWQWLQSHASILYVATRVIKNFRLNLDSISNPVDLQPLVLVPWALNFRLALRPLELSALAVDYLCNCLHPLKRHTAIPAPRL